MRPRAVAATAPGAEAPGLAVMATRLLSGTLNRMPTLRRGRFFLPLTALLVLSATLGCAVDQKKEVARYEEVLRANLLANEKEFSPTPTPGESLTLRQALDLASRRNEQL